MSLTKSQIYSCLKKGTRKTKESVTGMEKQEASRW